MKELLLLFFVSAFGFSQTLYKGNVNENGLPIPGVNVCVKIQLDVHSLILTEIIKF